MRPNTVEEGSNGDETLLQGAETSILSCISLWIVSNAAETDRTSDVSLPLTEWTCVIRVMDWKSCFDSYQNVAKGVSKNG